MKNMIIIDLETSDFDVSAGIYEVAMLVVENYEIVDKLHLGIVENELLLKNGYGMGYKNICYDEDMISIFKDFIHKYNYPLVAHSANFDRKFLLHYNWIDSDYPVYDSIRAIKYENPNLFSYALQYLLDFYNVNIKQEHTALKDVEDLYTILSIVKPSLWIPVGQTLKNKSKNINSNNSSDDNTKKSKSKSFNANDLENVEVVGDLFKDKNIVFTGKGPYPRIELSIIAMRLGATILNGVNKKTDILVVGEGAGSKLTKANDLGIEILSIDDFMDITSSLIDELEELHISREISNIEKRSTVRKSISKKSFDFNYENKILNDLTVSLVPMRIKMAEKLTPIIENLGGKPITSFRQKETSLLIYETYGEDFATVNKAKDKNIKTISLYKFNKLLLDNKVDDLI